LISFDISRIFETPNALLKENSSPDQLVCHTDGPVVREEIRATNSEIIGIKSGPITDRKTLLNNVIDAAVNKVVSRRILLRTACGISSDRSLSTWERMTSARAINRASKFPGHKSLQTTIDIYTHYTEKYDKNQNTLAVQFESYANEAWQWFDYKTDYQLGIFT